MPRPSDPRDREDKLSELPTAAWPSVHGTAPPVGVPGADIQTIGGSRLDDAVVQDIIRLTTGRWQGDDEQLAALAGQIEENETYQIVLALILDAGSRSTELSSEQQGRFAHLLEDLASLVRGPHIEDDPDIYERYLEDWLRSASPLTTDGGISEAGAHAQPQGVDQRARLGALPAASAHPEVVRHIARCERCEAQLQLAYSARLAKRIKRRIAIAAAAGDTAVPTAGGRGAEAPRGPARSASKGLETTHNWRATVRSHHPVVIAPGLRLTDYHSCDITVEGVAEGELAVLAWGRDALHQGHRRALKLLRPAFRDIPAMTDAFSEAIVAWCAAWRRTPRHSPPQLVRLPLLDDTPALLFDYAPHGSLRTILRRAHHGELLLSPQHAFGWSIEIAAALAALHDADQQAGVVAMIHGDLTPENILLDPDRSAWLADVGLSRVWAAAPAVNRTRLHAHGVSAQVQTAGSATAGGPPGAVPFTPVVGSRGPVVGTPAYMAPERWLGLNAVTPASDVYALGAIIFELFAGVPGGPFAPTPHNSEGWFHAHQRGPSRSLRSPDVAALTQGPLAQLAQPLAGSAGRDVRRAIGEETLYAIDVLVSQCLAPVPEDRPSADTVRRRLNELAERAGCLAEPIPEDATLDETAAYEHLHRLGHSYGHMGRHEEQLAALFEAATVAPRAEVWTTLGITLHEQGHDEAAAEAYAAASSLMPVDHRRPGHPAGARLAFHAANTYRSLGQHQQAIEQYRRSLDHDNQHAAALYGYSASLAHSALGASDPQQRRKQFEEAHSAIQRAAALAPGNSEIGRLHEQIAQALRDI